MLRQCAYLILSILVIMAFYGVSYVRNIAGRALGWGGVVKEDYTVVVEQAGWCLDCIPHFFFILVTFLVSIEWYFIIL